MIDTCNMNKSDTSTHKKGKVLEHVCKGTGMEYITAKKIVCLFGELFQFYIFLVCFDDLIIS